MIRLHHLKMASRFVARRFRQLYPFEVQASLLNACDLRCLYCRCPEIKTSLMTTDQWRTTIRRLGALGTMRIKFQGGEPTLRGDFRELCAEAKRAGIITAVTTNGLQVAEQPALLDYLDEVVFSLDSVTPEINNRLRGEGTHAQVVKAIDIARERELCTYVSMVVSRATLGELEAMLEFCEARNIVFHAQPIIFGWQYFGDAEQHFVDEVQDLALRPEEVRAMNARLAEWKRQGRRLVFSAWSYEKATDWPDDGRLTAPSEGESSCMAGKFYVHIEPNGNVHPCGQHQARLKPKNILKDGLEEALLHVQRHNCGDCWTAYLNERKALFGLKPSALWEVVRRSRGASRPLA